MKLDKKVIDLINEGFKAKTLKGFNDVQINQLYERVVKNKKKENKEETKQVVTNATYDLANTTDQQKLAQMGLHVDPATKKVTMSTSGGKIQTEEIDEDDLNITNDPDATADGMGIFEKEIDESKKKKKKINPWAICTKQLGDKFGTTERHLWSAKQKNKYESCIQQIKKENKGKIQEDLFIEQKILNLVQKYVEPKMTKKDLISLVERKESNSPATKPKEAPTKPDKTTSPKENPFDPFKPKPTPNPNPKAKVPNWLSFKKLGIKFKK